MNMDLYCSTLALSMEAGSTLLFGTSPNVNWSCILVEITAGAGIFEVVLGSILSPISASGSIIEGDSTVGSGDSFDFGGAFKPVLLSIESVLLFSGVDPIDGRTNGSGFWKLKLKLEAGLLLLLFPNICSADSCLVVWSFAGDVSATTVCLNDEETLGLYWVVLLLFKVFGSSTL